MTNNSAVTLFPGNVKGSITVPPSKSMSHRALICAALSKGNSTIENVLFSEDVKATISALKHLGAKFEVNGTTLTVTGVKKIKYDGENINCNESGSTIRFLIPVFSLSNKKVTFTGKKSLFKRPFEIYKNIFKSNGSDFEVYKDSIKLSGRIKANDYHIDGDVSSQFFSGLLFTLPLLKEDSRLFYNGSLESKSYIDLTIEVLEYFGIDIQVLQNGYYIPGNQSYKPADYYVEGDFSQASFHLVAGVISGYLQANNLSQESTQGDKKIIDIIKRMKGKVIFTENGFITEYSHTYGTTIDISDCPDLAPIVALLGSLSSGVTRITNISRLRMKESDRIESTVNTLALLGANIIVKDEQIIIHGKKMLDGGVTLDSYNDHRIAMMISIAALRCKQEILLLRPLAVNKSYPHFFEDYKNIGGKFIEKD
jgi:3-phosphoshikimate 1-carboxyvinyltransferase